MTKKTAKLFILIVSLCMVGALSGCATKKVETAPVFFPPPPDEPHVQFLTGVTSSADLGGKAGGVGKILVGGAETVTKLNKAYGITFKNGKVYVCDIGSSQIVVIDFINKTMKNLSDEIGPGELKKPVGVAVDDEGNVYVADSSRKDIAVYNAAGKYVKSLGRDFEHKSFVSVGVYKDFLIALDNHLGLIFIMDRKTGELLSRIGENPDRTKNLAMPNGLTVSPAGNILAVNMGNGSVKEYDLDGNMLSSFGRLGDSPGEFTRPRGLAVDEDGNIFVIDAGHSVAQVFNPQHRILGFFGQPGLPKGSMNLPAGVAVTRDPQYMELFQKYAAPGFKLQELVFITNQFVSPINHAVAVYGMGEMTTKKEEPKPKSAEPAEKKGQKGQKEEKPAAPAK